MYNHYQALIFDMDGTFVDSCRLHEFAWTTMLNKYAVSIDRSLKPYQALSRQPPYQAIKFWASICRQSNPI